MVSTSQFEGITLEKVGKGHLEDEFQQGLAEALEVFERAHEGIYQAKEKELRVTLHFSVDLVHSVDAGTTIIYGGLDKVKRPARVRKGAQAFISAGTVQVEKAQQSDLFEKGE